MAHRVCGICKRAPREDDSMAHIRIGDGWADGVEPGGYMACSECIDRFRPMVFEKLKNDPDGRFNHLEDASQVAGGLLS